MADKEMFLVVVSVAGGRNFPKRPRHHLVLEGRFDGVLLATDPVEHSENPNCTQELAWEMNKKALHQHRLQRSSIKVTCYAIDKQSTTKEPVGYVILDLRAAQQGKKTFKWHNLLHSKYNKPKAEIRVGLYIDDDTGQEKVKVEVPRPSVLDLKHLKPVLNEVGGFFQLGPYEECTEMFVLSITVAFAANLPHLIPASVPPPANADGYFFYYSLFGNDVTNEPFYDLLNPNFPAERASVKLRTSMEALTAFFKNQPGIVIHLCCGDQSLGSTEVSVMSLLTPESGEIYMRPLTIEGTYTLAPPNRVRNKLPLVPEDQQPMVGMSIQLRSEDQVTTPNLTPSKVPPTTQSPPTKLPKATKDKPGKSKSKEKNRPPRQDTPPDTLPQEPILHPRDDQAPPPGNSYSETFESEKTGADLSSIQEQDKARTKTTVDRRTPSPLVLDTQHGSPGKHGSLAPPRGPPGLPPGQQFTVVHQGGAAGPPGSSMASSITPQLMVPPQAQHFCVSIDLRTLRDLQVSAVANVFLKYTYAFFGSAAPILTHPSVEVRRGMEVSLMNSLCSFDFATTLHQLRDTFTRVPLFVEVFDRQKERSQDALLGVTRLPLAPLLNAEPTQIMREDGTRGTRQTYTDRLPILTVGSGNRMIGEVLVILSLENFGAINTQKLLIPHDVSQTTTSDQVPSHKTNLSHHAQEEPRESVEYKAALELEEWKEKQENIFESQLREKETAYLRNMSEEWKKRDKERDLLVKKKLAEYRSLEEQMRKTILDLDGRERQLAANEHEVMRLKADLEREHDRKLTEMREASRRMQEQCDHRIDLEKLKIADFQESITRLKADWSEAEKRYQAIDREFSQFRDQQNSKPEIRLQSEINLLTLEKVELERKFENSNKSKVHYKQQWGRALKELARLKEREQAEAKRRIRKEQQELEHMRLRYLAAEEKDVVKADKDELEGLKNEINRLREMEIQKMQQQQQQQEGQSSQHKGPFAPLQPDMDSTVDDHITRLIEERDALLRTGVYTSEDRIIAELDRQIRENIGQKY